MIEMKNGVVKHQFINNFKLDGMQTKHLNLNFISDNLNNQSTNKINNAKIATLYIKLLFCHKVTT